MKLHTLFTAALAFLAFSQANAQTAPSLKKLAISDVAATEALKKSANHPDNLDRVAQSLGSQLIDRIQNTRKFEIIARSDAAALNKEAETAGAKLQLNGADYLLVTTVDDFQDHLETKTFAALGKTVEIRTIRFGAIGKIYEAASGKLVESTNFNLIHSEPQDTSGSTSSDGYLSDGLLRSISKDMAERIATRLADTIFPIRVVAILDKQVTLNRGEGSGVQIGQIWTVFSQGQDLVDPDTGASLGKQEKVTGKVRIVQVNPKTSIAEILEDAGIDRLAVLRLLPAKD